VTLGAGQLGPDRVGHAYATTVHRFQGSTVDRSHLYADGGGRELAYVAMSRAQHASSVYVVADDLDQARADLGRDWAVRRTPVWAIDSALPGPQQLKSDPQAVGERAAIVALRHVHDGLLAAATEPGRPPAPTKQAEEARAALAQARRHLAELADPAGLAGIHGAYETGPVGDAARHAALADERLGQLEHAARAGGWSERCQASRDLPATTAVAEAAEDRLAALVNGERAHLHQHIGRLETSLEGLDNQAAVVGQRWQQTASVHATATQAQQRLDRALQTARRRLEQPDRPDQPARRRRTPAPWLPAPRHVIDPPEAIPEGPDL